MKNSQRLREIYPKTLSLDAAVADPRVMGCDLLATVVVVFYCSV